MVSAENVPPDDELVEATLAGDDQAYAELARRYKGRVFGVAARFARDAAELDDICQDIFVQAYFKLRQFRRDSPFEHWLLRIATFKCYDYLRKRRRSAPTVSVDAMLESGYEPSAPEQPEAHPDLERLHLALAQLSPKERLVITLLELEEQSVQQIADLTGWSVANVKVRAFRARAALRKLIEEQNMNPPEPDAKLDALFAQARARRPDTSAAQYAFETRLMARLRAERETSSIWATVSWRLAPFLAVVVVALAIWQAEFAVDLSDTAILANFTNSESVDPGSTTN